MSSWMVQYSMVYHLWILLHPIYWFPTVLYHYHTYQTMYVLNISWSLFSIKAKNIG